MGVARAAEPLRLTSATSPPGEEVTAEQPVTPAGCGTFRVRWQTATGTLLGSDSGGDGTGTVAFRVPSSASPGDHLLVATCGTSGGGQESVVGTATLVVTALSTTTTAAAGTAAGSTAPRTTVVTSGPPTTRAAPATATTVPPPPPPAPAPQSISDCERQAQEAQAAALVYQPRQRMFVGQTYPILAALGLTPGDVASIAFPGPGATTVTTVQGTRCTVDAYLDGQDFEVTPGERRAQSFIGTRALIWEWQVRARHAGKDLRLTLHLQPRVVEASGGERPGPDRSTDAIITVEARPVPVLTRVSRVVAAVFSSDALRYLLLPASGAGFLTAGVLRRVRKRKRARPARAAKRRRPRKRHHPRPPVARRTQRRAVAAGQ